MFNFIMYADDTTLTSTISTFSDNTNNDNVEASLNAELLKINEWLQINKLSLNISKSKYMIFQKVDKDVQHLTLNPLAGRATFLSPTVHGRSDNIVVFP